MQRKADEIAWANEEGRRKVGQLSEREFLMAGAALYAGEGAKRDGQGVRPSTSTDAHPFSTRVRVRTVKSWVWYVPCYPATSFRGSSTGRASDC